MIHDNDYPSNDLLRARMTEVFVEQLTLHDVTARAMFLFDTTVSTPIFAV
jgi:hypothetical protein